jgi:hypothetical protein
MARDHGGHNKQVCDILHLQDELECNDWVITTAFYSSIHYFDHLLFPFIHTTGVKFENISEAHNVIREKNKHETRGILVQRKIPAFGKDYNFLKNECYNARYYNYRIDENFAKKAVRALESVIKESDKKEEADKKAKK